MNNFSIYVIPFCTGVLLLLGFSVLKYWRWIKRFDKLQQAIIRKNIWSWKFLPAIWEAFREGLLHWRIAKKNWLLGYMHRSLAFGWFLLIVVGFVQALLAFPFQLCGAGRLPRDHACRVELGPLNWTMVASRAIELETTVRISYDLPEEEGPELAGPESADESAETALYDTL